MKLCIECGHQMGENAPACSNCGEPNPYAPPVLIEKHRKPLKKQLLIAWGIVISNFLCGIPCIPIVILLRLLQFVIEISDDTYFLILFFFWSSITIIGIICVISIRFKMWWHHG